MPNSDVREVATSAVTLRPVSENSSGLLSLRQPDFSTVRYPNPFQEAGNALVSLQGFRMFSQDHDRGLVRDIDSGCTVTSAHGLVPNSSTGSALGYDRVTFPQPDISPAFEFNAIPHSFPILISLSRSLFILISKAFQISIIHHTIMKFLKTVGRN
ncbi:hypothetical protein EVAR_94680_1 [Eumeta japonica]|uniref:Uncharacterized protein n=1 Tax=Eumeta variegata TaxID=151549 RepID=A0A4C1UW90_EUMVA|nr:hypothetical protein EVAR_94680_1 [Eumeta japonica]